jgi:hypothetical protein
MYPDPGQRVLIVSDPELERFKTAVNLSEYAAAHGYTLLHRESSCNSVVMRRTDGDKIIIARDMKDGHWVYFSVRDERDNGSVIDFIQKRQQVSLGKVRQILRAWTEQGVLPFRRPAPGSYAAHVEKSSKDRQTIITLYSAMEAAQEHPYLQSRAVGKEILIHPRFVGRVRVDRHGAAIFPHEDDQGLSGYEMKNHNRFTGFAPGGEKTLWSSNQSPDDVRLVIAESAIDALSYHALHPDSHTRYASTAGAWSDKTRARLHCAGAQHPGPEIILAFDNDEQGRKYEAEARVLLADTGKTIAADYPPPGLDWNDQLQATRRHQRRFKRHSTPSQVQR